jgi:RNA polymerase sigma factor (sigma-70 family)
MKVVRGSPEERAILNHNADLRREERHKKKELSLDQLGEKGYQISEGEESDETDNEIGILNELLPLIPAKQREAFELALFKHLSERKISEILKISKTAVHKRLQKAVKNLRFLVEQKNK